MDAFDVALAVASNLGAPTLFIAALGLSRDGSPATVVMDAVVALLFVSAVAMTVQWLALPRGLVALLVLAWLAAVLYRARRIEAGEHRRRRAWFRWLPRVVFASAGAWIVTGALVGHRPNPGSPVELAAPLPEGTWVAVNGGSTSMVNAHLRTLEGPAAPEWRGQSFAVDLVGAGAWGSRTRPVLRPELTDFEIFDVPILAPCSGTVVQATDGEPDRRSDDDPWRSRTGNHVLLDCDGAWILLAHMSARSVRARTGDVVATGDTLGRVGNTGASGEPHLHIHAQTPGSLAAPFSGLPRPITINGRRLIRHDRLRVESWAAKARSGASAIWNEVVSTDLRQEVPEVRVPVYLLHGIHDRTCSYDLARDYAATLSAPVRGFYSFWESAHSPIFEEPERVQRIAREDVLQGTANLADIL